MIDLANEISKIIKDYRLDDIDDFYDVKMTPEHILKWVNQFDEKDRRFLLSELLNILPKSYWSKKLVKNVLLKGLKHVADKNNYESIIELLSCSKVLSCQADYKSQSHMLIMLDEILYEEFNVTLVDIELNVIDNWLYIDDVLSSGGTFRKDIVSEIESYGLTKFKHSNIKLIGLFMSVHALGASNTRFSLEQNLKFNLDNRLSLYRARTIDNNFKDKSSALEMCYPLESQLGLDFLDDIEERHTATYPMKYENYAFRESTKPITETFFSSSKNRVRYENIFLEKGISLINQIQNMSVQNHRPLGVTPAHYKTLGTGSHFFTWRNISNTCPIVFWWEANGWYPLFPVKNRGR